MVVAPIRDGFTLQKLGTPQEAAQTFLQTTGGAEGGGRGGGGKVLCFSFCDSGRVTAVGSWRRACHWPLFLSRRLFGTHSARVLPVCSESARLHPPHTGAPQRTRPLQLPPRAQARRQRCWAQGHGATQPGSSTTSQSSQCSRIGLPSSGTTWQVRGAQRCAVGLRAAGGAWAHARPPCVALCRVGSWQQQAPLRGGGAEQKA